MLTEAELRKYLAALKKLVKQPCDCADRGHSRECRAGGYGMQVEIRLLGWVLGDDFLLGNQVERFLKAAAELPGSEEPAR